MAKNKDDVAKAIVMKIKKDKSGGGDEKGSDEKYGIGKKLIKAIRDEDAGEIEYLLEDFVEKCTESE